MPVIRLLVNLERVDWERTMRRLLSGPSGARGCRWTCTESVNLLIQFGGTKRGGGTCCRGQETQDETCQHQCRVCAHLTVLVEACQASMLEQQSIDQPRERKCHSLFQPSGLVDVPERGCPGWQPVRWSYN